MKRIVGIIAFVSGAAVFGAAQQNYPILIFDFPDGYKGGVGQVSGYGPSIGDDIRPVGDDIVPVLHKCGLDRTRRFSRMSHRYFVYARASGRDQQIVRCLMKATNRHFNVGYGKNDVPLGVPRILDTTPFEKFARKSP